MPAFPQMHGDAAIAAHVVLEQAAVLGMLLVKLQAILLATEQSRQLRRAGVIAQLAIQVHRPHHLQVGLHRIR